MLLWVACPRIAPCLHSFLTPPPPSLTFPLPQLFFTGESILAMTSSSLTLLTVPNEDADSTQISIMPVPPSSRLTLVQGRHGGREVKLDRWAVEGGLEEKMLGGGFSKGENLVRC